MAPHRVVNVNLKPPLGLKDCTPVTASYSAVTVLQYGSKLVYICPSFTSLFKTKTCFLLILVNSSLLFCFLEKGNIF